MRLDNPKPKAVIQQLKINPFDLIAVDGINPNVLEITTKDKEYRIADNRNDVDCLSCNSDPYDYRL